MAAPSIYSDLDLAMFYSARASARSRAVFGAQEGPKNGGKVFRGFEQLEYRFKPLRLLGCPVALSRLLWSWHSRRENLQSCRTNFPRQWRAGVSRRKNRPNPARAAAATIAALEFTCLLATDHDTIGPLTSD
eukprot:scaffold3153_cov243-Pinguiococcus_pyrenoidosus.AAC.4